MSDQNIDHVFRIYGDNILECELFIDWLNQSTTSEFEQICEKGAIDRPIFLYNDKVLNQIFAFQLCPFFGSKKNNAWNNNPLINIFSETPDVVIVRIEDNSETDILFAIEFDDAIQAGNQSWQRSRRSLDAAKHKIPYFYILPIIGWEHGKTSLKNPRFQNAQITIGHLILSDLYKVPSLQIFKESLWSEHASELKYLLPVDYENFSGLSSVIKFACYLIRLSTDPDKNISKPYFELKNIFIEMHKVASTYVNHNTSVPIFEKHIALSPSNFVVSSNILTEQILGKKNKFSLSNISYDDFLKNGVLFKKEIQDKTILPDFRINILDKINWNNNYNFNEHQNWLKNWDVIIKNGEDPKCIALNNKRKIPITYKNTKSESALIGNRQALQKIMKCAYPKLTDDVLNWIFTKSKTLPIFFIPLYGYKPRADDSRPDRGLIPYLHASFPKLLKKKNTMVLVYSKHVPDNWEDLLANDSNQLWTAIKEYCGLVIVDKNGKGVLL